MIARSEQAVRAGLRMESPLSAQSRRNFVRVPVSYRAELHERAFRPRYGAAAADREGQGPTREESRVQGDAEVLGRFKG
jgi:hypothetical protein